MKLKPGATPQKTSEGGREEQGQGPGREQGLHRPRAGEEGGMARARQGRQRAAQDEAPQPRASSSRTRSWEFLPSDTEGH